MKPKLGLGSCNGLLYIVNQNNTNCLWNLSTGKLSRIPVSKIYLVILGKLVYGITLRYIYGFGHSAIVKDYEIIEIVCFGKPTHIHPSEVAVYSLKSKLWTSIPDIPYRVCSKMGVHVNGALHWTATHYTTPESETLA
ncbi:hypothetical protein IFM89_021272 [Coptis chinensis]|uniref:F-box associated beta-propeller type 1 domain-containing protein n=1 Tax=Coptis chinensis TaxID=261450 RepID=A0A835HWF4_9MAGN|nr:hypothetical protein IFM89_021272 [Coptis chinensis]